LRLSRGYANRLILFRHAVNTFISRIWKFLIERLPPLRATAGLACGALDSLHGALDSKQPRCGLYNVT
jgi:hypothetical protein